MGGGVNPTLFWGWTKSLKNRDRCLQFGAYNFGTGTNFCTIGTAVELEENDLQDFVLP